VATIIRHLDEAVKRVVDILAASAGLLVLAPLMGLIALAIKLDSPGSVFFAHRRVGRYGRPFKVKERNLKKQREKRKNKKKRKKRKKKIK
jgi:lipopolysaccharide/colanic/teichoic acid biosynthesis glycosyltransferase